MTTAADQFLAMTIFLLCKALEILFFLMGKKRGKGLTSLYITCNLILACLIQTEISLTANIKLQILIHENCVLCRIVFADYLKLASFYWASLESDSRPPAQQKDVVLLM